MPDTNPTIAEELLHHIEGDEAAVDQFIPSDDNSVLVATLTGVAALCFCAWLLVYLGVLQNVAKALLSVFPGNAILKKLSNTGSVFHKKKKGVFIPTGDSEIQATDLFPVMSSSKAVIFKSAWVDKRFHIDDFDISPAAMFTVDDGRRFVITKVNDGVGYTGVCELVGSRSQVLDYTFVSEEVIVTTDND